MSPPCAVCGADAVCRCARCGRSACGQGPHVASLFLTHRYGTMADQIGSKFAFLCPTCGGAPVCADCMGLRSGYPCPEAQIEAHPFACPRCGGRVELARFDGVSGPEAAQALLALLRSPPATPGERVPYEGHDRLSQVDPRSIEHHAFGPRTEPLRPGDAWETCVRSVASDGARREWLLRCFEHPEPRVDLLALTSSGAALLGRVEPDQVYYDSRLLGSALAPALSLSVDTGGVFVANLHPSSPLEVEKRGIVRSVGLAPPRSLSHLAEPGDIPTGDAARTARKFDELLGHVSALRIWDYQWLEAPRSRFGKGAILAMAGSTDLTYYELIRLVFKGVRYNSTRDYFHHPDFRRAPPGAARQLRDLASFGERSQVVCVTRDFGSNLEGTGFVVCDYLFVIDDENELKKSYNPRKNSNVGWWL